MTPGPGDLFMNIWYSYISGEEATIPGTKDWGDNRAEMKRQWLAVWEDCRELSEAIEDYEKTKDELSLLTSGEEGE